MYGEKFSQTFSAAVIATVGLEQLSKNLRECEFGGLERQSGTVEWTAGVPRLQRAT